MIPALIGVAVLVAILFFSQSGQAAEQVGGSVKYDYSGLLQLAQDAGFDADSGTAAAIALAESGGDPEAVGDRSLAPEKGPSVGLWQIDIGTREHPEVTEEQMKDPVQNAAKAFQIYSDAGGFSPWSTFKSGAYQQFLQ